MEWDKLLSEKRQVESEPEQDVWSQVLILV